MNQKLCSMRCKLTEAMDMMMKEDILQLDTDETGKIIDMIKDLAEAEKYIAEAEYYCTVVEAMEDGAEDRFGYNGRRYSSGRYAPKGRGHVMGYRPFLDEEPYVDAFLNDPDFKEGMNRRYGNAYNGYKTAKRHYTQSHSESDKAAMRTLADEHVMDTIVSIRDIWAGADPEHRKRMKGDIQNLLNEMTV